MSGAPDYHVKKSHTSWLKYVIDEPKTGADIPRVVFSQLTGGLREVLDGAWARYSQDLIDAREQDPETARAVTEHDERVLQITSRLKAITERYEPKDPPGDKPEGESEVEAEDKPKPKDAQISEEDERLVKEIGAELAQVSSDLMRGRSPEVNALRGRYNAAHRAHRLRVLATMVRRLAGDWRLVDEELAASPAWPKVDPLDPDAALGERIRILAYVDERDLERLQEDAQKELERGAGGLTEEESKN